MTVLLISRHAQREVTRAAMISPRIWTMRTPIIWTFLMLTDSGVNARASLPRGFDATYE